MKRSQIAIGALVAASLIRPGVPAGPPKNTVVNTSSAIDLAKKDADVEPKNAIEFLCRSFEITPADADACPKQLEHQGNWRTLIATVPDPKRTHLALYFDRIVEALVWAVDDAGFTLVDHWFPWKPETAGGEDRSFELEQRKSANAGTTRLKLSPGAESAAGKPGVLLFRSGVSRDFLVVWLVGETPTGVLDAKAFRETLRMHDALTGNADVHIVGPSFSGTLPALSDVLANECNRTVKIITGMVTNRDAMNSFHERMQECGLKLESTVENDTVAFNLFVHYVWRHHWGNPGEIAILAESGTAYGQVTDAIEAEINDLKKEGRKQDHEQWLIMRFPREISRLRNAYEEDTAAATVQSEKTQPATQTLQLKLKTPETDRDTVPAFSKQLSPLSQEAALLSLATALRRERVRYAGIIATDVLDAAFLARFLRTAAPDVRVFMFDADLLFARAELATPLDGILNVTTYPLFSRNQHWTHEQLAAQLPERTPFASRTAEGVYNAARAQLWRIKQSGRGGGTVDSGEVMLEYMRPFAPPGIRPPLWVTVLGRNGYWPVALLDPKQESSLMDSVKPERVEEDLHPEPPSHVWSFLLNLTMIFAVVHCLFVWFAYLKPQDPNGSRRQRAGNAISVFVYRLLSTYPRGREREYPKLLLLVTLPLAAAQLVFAASAAPYIFRAGATVWSWWYFVVPVIALVCLVATAVSLFWVKHGRDDGVRLRWSALAVSLVFVAFWIVLVSAYYDADGRVFFFLYRMVHVDNGVSPGLPVVLLLAVMFTWGFAQLARRATVEPPDVPNIREIRTHAAQLNARLREIIPLRRLTLAAIIVVLWALQFHPWDRLRSIEGSTYDWLIIFLLSLSYTLIFGAWVQVLMAWGYFRRVLEALERHPMREAFTRLPKAFATLPLFRPEPQKADLFTSARCQDSLDALLQNAVLCPPGEDEEFSARSDEIHKWIRAARMHLAEGEREQPACYAQTARESQKLQLAVLNAANALIPRAENLFWYEGFSDSLESEAERVEPKRALSDRERGRIVAEEFIALRFVMYIRHVLRQLRSLLWFIVLGFVLTILALSTYPFLSHRLIELSSILLFLLIGTGLAFVFAQMDRDAILSRLTQTKPNEIGKEFWFRMASFGALPLLTVVTTQFPSVRNIAFSWLEPALQALK